MYLKKKACGGTTLNHDGTSITSLKSWQSESAWSCYSPSQCAFGYGSNGGYSIHFPRPSYQNGIQTNGFRGVPDLSSNAYISTILCFNDFCYTVGGMNFFVLLFKKMEKFNYFLLFFFSKAQRSQPLSGAASRLVS